MRRYLGEYIGTFALVFAGTGAIVINEFSGGAITHPGIAITFGLIVMTMIYAVGDISGAHLNPAVTAAFWVARLLPGREVLPYILSQIAGGVSASLVLRLIFPESATLGATLPAITPLGAFVFELLLTFILMFVIIHVSTGAKEKGLMAGVAIGGAVALEAMFAGPATGASMNPVRSLAPALVSGHLAGLWIYLTAPLAGAALAVLTCRLLRGKECCTVPDTTESVQACDET
jgi:aquaporin Z